MRTKSASKLANWLDSKRLVFAFVATMFLVLLLPYVVKGWDVWINQFDNLDQISFIGIFDGEFKGQFLPSDDMPQYYLPGMEPIFRVSILSVQKLFWQLGFFTGYVVNELVYRILGFIGFYLLLRRLFMGTLPRAYPALLALSYVFLPFWPQGGLSVAGLPLLAWAFLLIYNNQKRLLAYFVVVLYTLYSGFFLTGVFVIAVMLVLILSLAYKRISYKRLLPPLVIMIILYVTVNYSFFVIAFIDKIPTNRSEIQLSSESLGKILKEFFITFFTKSHLHAHSFHKYLLLPVSVLGIWAMLKNKKYPWRNLMFIMSGFIVFCAIVFSLYRYKPVNDFYAHLNFGFDYSRFYFLAPPVWYLMAGLALTYFIKTARFKTVAMGMVLVLLLVQLCINYSFTGYKPWVAKPTLQEVISQNQFKRIEQFLQQSQPGFSKQNLRIGCIGFSPAVANFNGFKTLGAYCPSYPLHLKYEFIDIIEGEMAKNKYLNLYMKNWGSQLYLFDDRIFVSTIDQRKLRKRVKSISCELDLDKLREKEVDLLFSAAPITNAKTVGLTMLTKDIGSYYHFYVYKL